tara:strand:+ start:978 stop:1187 length:210 start_codon:yes stop_codon:yes gene_type:complete
MPKTNKKTHKLIKKWKEQRIAEINLWSKNKNKSCSDSNPYFEEIQAIYRSKAKTYQDFKKEFDTKEIIH